MGLEIIFMYNLSKWQMWSLGTVGGWTAGFQLSSSQTVGGKPDATEQVTGYRGYLRQKFLA
jgi:hypothetical protein